MANAAVATVCVCTAMGSVAVNAGGGGEYAILAESALAFEPKINKTNATPAPAMTVNNNAANHMVLPFKLKNP